MGHEEVLPPCGRFWNNNHSLKGSADGHLTFATDLQIQPVHPKGDHSWMFTGRTDAEAEAPIFWPPDAKSWLPGKDPDAGKDWRREEKGTTEDEMAGWPHWHDGHESEQALGDADGQKFEQTLGDGEGQGSLAMLQSMGSQRVGHDWAIELNWTELNWRDDLKSTGKCE